MIPESEAGFRSGYSTIDHIFSLQSIIKNYLSKGRGRFYVLFIDFTKAFDCIPRNKLWQVLKNKAIKGKMLNILKSMYKNVFSEAFKMHKHQFKRTKLQGNIS